MYIQNKTITSNFNPKNHTQFSQTDRHDITEILLKVALNTIKQTNKQKKTDLVIQIYLGQETNSLNHKNWTQIQ
jgi:hypothetical protein